MYTNHDYQLTKEEKNKHHYGCNLYASSKSNTPPINSFELGADDMLRIAWKTDGDGRNSELILRFAACLSIFPSLPKKAIAVA